MARLIDTPEERTYMQLKVANRIARFAALQRQEMANRGGKRAAYVDVIVHAMEADLDKFPEPVGLLEDEIIELAKRAGCTFSDAELHDLRGIAQQLRETYNRRPTK